MAVVLFVQFEQIFEVHLQNPSCLFAHFYPKYLLLCRHGLFPYKISEWQQLVHRPAIKVVCIEILNVFCGLPRIVACSLIPFSQRDECWCLSSTPAQLLSFSGVHPSSNTAKCSSLLHPAHSALKAFKHIHQQGYVCSHVKIVIVTQIFAFRCFPGFLGVFVIFGENVSC